MEYTVEYFISKFEKIPSKKYCIGTRFDGYGRCTLGWCYPTNNDAKLSENCAIPDSDEETVLTFLIENLNCKFGVAGINNGIYEEYPQKTPKQRILAALYDIRDKELSQANVIEVEKIINTELVNY